MSTDKLARVIDEAFEGRDKIGPKTKGAVRKAVNSALDLLDAGQVDQAERPLHALVALQLGHPVAEVFFEPVSHIFADAE